VRILRNALYLVYVSPALKLTNCSSLHTYRTQEKLKAVLRSTWHASGDKNIVPQKNFVSLTVAIKEHKSYIYSSHSFCIRQALRMVFVCPLLLSPLLCHREFGIVKKNYCEWWEIVKFIDVSDRVSWLLLPYYCLCFQWQRWSAWTHLCLLTYIVVAKRADHCCPKVALCHLLALISWLSMQKCFHLFNYIVGLLAQDDGKWMTTKGGGKSFSSVVKLFTHSLCSSKL